jgi:hypothetical protein
MDFGCFYNKRPAPGRCIKDPRSTVVEKECEKTENSCRLKDLPKMRTVVKSEDKKKLSGPVSAFVTQFENKKYEFFGDAHYSMENTCSPCQDINLKDLQLVQPAGSEDCWDISVLLSKMFTEASEKNVWIDFYIEIPFLSKNSFRPSEKEIYSQVESFGYIYKLYYIFYNCFNKLKCKYNTTRFHYVDVRLEYKKLNLPALTQELENLITMQNTFTTQFNNYEMYITMSRVNDAIDELGRIVVMNERKRNSFIETTDKLMRDLYFSGGQTLQGKVEPKNIRLFNLYLTSDNFADDATKLMQESFASLKDPNAVLRMSNILIPPRLIVNRRGKNMHKVRAQFEALENEGQGEIAKLIVDFLLKEYRKNTKVNEVIDLWRGIMISYEGFINSKYSSMEDVYMLIERFKKEMRKFEDLISFTISSASLLMDAYTLVRMFRKFGDKPHVDSEKSIVYAGGGHINTYVKFFEEVLKTSFIKYEPNPNLMKNFKTGKIQRCFEVNINDF